MPITLARDMSNLVHGIETVCDSKWQGLGPYTRMHTRASFQAPVLMNYAGPK